MTEDQIRVEFWNTAFTKDYTQVPNDILRDSSLSVQARFLWLLLASYAFERPAKSFPSEKTLAEHMGVTERTIRSYITELQRRGYLEVQSRYGKTNLYLLYLPGEMETLKEIRKPASKSGDDQEPQDDESGNVLPVNNKEPKTEPLVEETSNEVSVYKEPEKAQNLEKKRRASIHEAFAQGHLASVKKVVASGRAYDLKREFRPVWTKAWQQATEIDNLDPSLVGTALLAYYWRTLMDDEPDYGRLTRLVRKWGLLSLEGIDAVLRYGDVKDPYTYAWVVCEGMMNEHLAEQQKGGP